MNDLDDVVATLAELADRAGPALPPDADRMTAMADVFLRLVKENRRRISGLVDRLLSGSLLLCEHPSGRAFHPGPSARPR